MFIMDVHTCELQLSSGALEEARRDVAIMEYENAVKKEAVAIFQQDAAVLEQQVAIMQQDMKALKLSLIHI